MSSPTTGARDTLDILRAVDGLNRYVVVLCIFLEVQSDEKAGLAIYRDFSSVWA